jgi:hypothetical protein
MAGYSPLSLLSGPGDFGLDEMGSCLRIQTLVLDSEPGDGYDFGHEARLVNQHGIVD